MLDVDCNGVKVRIMYDTGASISFARPGLVVGTVEELMPLAVEVQWCRCGHWSGGACFWPQKVTEKNR